MTDVLTESLASTTAKLEGFGVNADILKRGLSPEAEAAILKDGDPSLAMSGLYKDNPMLKKHEIVTVAQAKPVIRNVSKAYPVISYDFARFWVDMNLLYKNDG